ncbi:MetS family NSS transporter small subunit [Thermococcus sp.]
MLSGGAIAMLIFGAVVLYGGFAYCLRIAMRKRLS